MSFVAQNFDAPVSFEIPGGLKPGKSIFIRGKVNSSQNGCAFNIRETKDGGDILLHFNPRHDAGIIARNTCSGGNWGDEERGEPFYGFAPGSTFELLIEVVDAGYHTQMNGQVFIKYGHRIDVRRGRYLQLSDGIDYDIVQIRDNFTIPYCMELSGGMNVGRALKVKGIATSNKGFTFNFASDPGSNNVAFHFTTRPGEGTIVMNSKLGDWGEEDSGFRGDFPFHEGRYFDILFVCAEKKFYVIVNGKDFADFSHRSDVSASTYLNIGGDVDIADMQLLDPVEENYIQKIPSGMSRGDFVVCRGMMKPDTTVFAVNLIEGLLMDSDISLHFTPRTDKGIIAYNTRNGGSWGDEQTSGIPHCISNNQPFELEIAAKRDKFRVKVDGCKIMKFPARSPFNNTQGIHICAGVLMYQVKFTRNRNNENNQIIPGGLQPGKWIVIHGKVKKNCTRFHVNFSSETDVAFHYNPRFGGNQCTVRNTKENDAWQTEERDEQRFPFQEKQFFELIFRVTKEKFMVYVDGEHHIDFEHRLPLSKICKLELGGDAKYFDVDFL